MLRSSPQVCYLDGVAVGRLGSADLQNVVGNVAAGAAAVANLPPLLPVIQNLRASTPGGWALLTGGCATAHLDHLVSEDRQLRAVPRLKVTLTTGQKLCLASAASPASETHRPIRASQADSQSQPCSMLLYFLFNPSHQGKRPQGRKCSFLETFTRKDTWSDFTVQQEVERLRQVTHFLSVDHHVTCVLPLWVLAGGVPPQDLQLLVGVGGHVPWP